MLISQIKQSYADINEYLSSAVVLQVSENTQYAHTESNGLIAEVITKRCSYKKMFGVSHQWIKTLKKYLRRSSVFSRAIFQDTCFCRTPLGGCFTKSQDQLQFSVFHLGVQPKCKQVKKIHSIKDFLQLVSQVLI